ncbi:myelin protein P0 [Agelaius phoeniceus]|uniref:myelin protein P0 n=1 Tax=Agelaius phoeniceus TaxID=39638 RepID=UPI004054BB93
MSPPCPPLPHPCPPSVPSIPPPCPPLSPLSPRATFLLPRPRGARECGRTKATSVPVPRATLGVPRCPSMSPLSGVPAARPPRAHWPAFGDRATLKPRPRRCPLRVTATMSPRATRRLLLVAGLVAALGLSPVSPIHVYTQREVYGTVGSSVTLSCSFWSSEWISEDISITWHFQAEGSRDSISIFHYAKGQPYIDDVGTFKERMEWAGNPRRRDGSIVIHGLEPSDNGTFTCDVKNPPDIVGKSSQVTLYVLEKVPPRYGVVLGSVIGGALLLVAALVALGYGSRYCWRRRQAALQRRLSAMEKGKLQRSGKDGSKRSRQAPVLYAMLDHGRSAKKAKGGAGDSRKDRK